MPVDGGAMFSRTRLLGRARVLENAAPCFGSDFYEDEG